MPPPSPRVLAADSLHPLRDRRRRETELAGNDGERELAERGRRHHIDHHIDMSAPSPRVYRGARAATARVAEPQKEILGEAKMSSQNKIIYEHLKDYPTSSECFHDIGNRAIPAAWAHKPEIAEASPEKRPQSAVRDGSE